MIWSLKYFTLRQHLKDSFSALKCLRSVWAIYISSNERFVPIIHAYTLYMHTNYWREKYWFPPAWMLSSFLRNAFTVRYGSVSGCISLINSLVRGMPMFNKEEWPDLKKNEYTIHMLHDLHHSIVWLDECITLHVVNYYFVWQMHLQI